MFGDHGVGAPRHCDVGQGHLLWPEGVAVDNDRHGLRGQTEIAVVAGNGTAERKVECFKAPTLSCAWTT
jgi:hypothetical protein